MVAPVAVMTLEKLARATSAPTPITSKQSGTNLDNSTVATDGSRGNSCGTPGLALELKEYFLDYVMEQLEDAGEASKICRRSLIENGFVQRWVSEAKDATLAWKESRESGQK